MWFKDYLSEKIQVTKTNNVTSHIRNVDIGVPHGSIFVPTLFLIYINSLSLWIGKCQCVPMIPLLFTLGKTLTNNTNKSREQLKNKSNWLVEQS